MEEEKSNSESVQTIETALPPTIASSASTPDEIHIHLKTVLAILAINLIVFAQIMAVIGSGFLAHPTAALLGDDTKAVWMATALSIGTCALNPPLSQAADLWGRKWILVVTTACAFVGAIIVARSQNTNTVIAGFCVLGLSFGSQSSLYAIPSEVIKRKHRAWAQASVNVSSGVSACATVLFGGALLRHTEEAQNYRIFWYVVAALYFLATISALFGYTPPARELQRTLTTSEKLRRVDWGGSFLITGGITLLCIALQWSGNPYSWKDAHILGTFIIGIAMFIAFGLFEWLFTSEGILNHSLFEQREFVMTLVVIFCEGLAFFTTNGYFVFEISVLAHLDLFEASLRFLVLFLTSTGAAIASGFWITKTKQIREPMALGFLGLTVFNALMASVKYDTPAANYWGYAIFSGLGLGLLLVTLFLSAQMSVSADLISPATGIIVAVRGLGAAVGLAINNALFQDGINKLPVKVAEAVMPLGFAASELSTLLQALSSGDPKIIAQVPGAGPHILAAAEVAMMKAYTLAFRYTWVAACSFSTAGFILTLFIRNQRHQFTAHIDAPAEEALVVLQEKVEATHLAREHGRETTIPANGNEGV